MRVMPDPYHAGENLVEQLPTGEWVERAQYFEAVAVNWRRRVRYIEGREQVGAEGACLTLLVAGDWLLVTASQR